jgi:hypothetical protein
MLVLQVPVYHFAPRQASLPTCVMAAVDEMPLLGQITHSTGASYARLSFLAPAAALESGELPVLLDQIAMHVGERGAFHILAEVNEHSLAFDTLHSSGFAIYARQRIWQLNGDPVGDAKPVPWRSCTSRDLTEAHSLYNNVVPGLVQQAEPFPRHRLRGLIYYQEGNIIAYVEYRYGLRGIWVQPFIHPDAGDFVGHLVDMLQALPNRRSRPVYLCIRSYQSWLEPTVKEMGAQPGPVQAVMVRHLAISRRITQPLAIPAINAAWQN